MLLVANCESSKTNWKLLLPSGNTQSFETVGINPIFSTEKEIFRILSYQNQFAPFASKIKELFFFGAGCNSPDRREFVSNALSSKFVNAFVSVETDLTGAAYATCGSMPGLNCIIDTESNISFFDGNEVTEINAGLGYILGDEASGTYFGKKLITDFLYNKMPINLASVFQKTYQINKEIVIKNIYQKPLANYYLASFIIFMGEFKDDPYIQNILTNSFTDFVLNNIVSYQKYKQYKTHFVGSIAFNFKNTLLSVCKSYDVNVGRVIYKPIDALFEFIKHREKF